jgi:hypothetical protein
MLNKFDNSKGIEVLRYLDDVDKFMEENCEEREMKEQCLVCYGNDERPYYVCNNNHEYHYECLESYYKKFDVTVNCFYCKGRYDFSKVYRCCSKEEQ